VITTGSDGPSSVYNCMLNTSIHRCETAIITEVKFVSEGHGVHVKILHLQNEPRYIIA